MHCSPSSSIVVCSICVSSSSEVRSQVPRSKRMKKGGSKLGRCLGAPVRVLSRACDSACALYVRGMSGYARRVPAAVGAVAVGRGFGRPTTATMHLRESSDRRGDLVRAASNQQRRRVAAVPADAGAVKKGARVSLQAPVLVLLPVQKKGAGMGAIAEDAPCHFGPAGDAPKPMRRGAAVGGLAARASAFGAIKTGSCEAFPRATSVAPACYT